MTAFRLTATCALLASLALAAPEIPPFSLDDDAVPRKYSIDLTIDPERDSFEGTARIEVELLKRLPGIWLNATGLTVLEVTAQTTHRTMTARATAHPDDLLAIEPESPAGALFDKGHLTLTIRYRAPLGDKPVIGPYRLQFENRWYVFTTF